MQVEEAPSGLCCIRSRSGSRQQSLYSFKSSAERKRRAKRGSLLSAEHGPLFVLVSKNLAPRFDSTTLSPQQLSETQTMDFYHRQAHLNRPPQEAAANQLFLTPPGQLSSSTRSMRRRAPSRDSAWQKQSADGTGKKERQLVSSRSS